MPKKILIIGAGKSSPYLIRHLYKNQSLLNISLEIVSNEIPNFISHFPNINFNKIDIFNKKDLRLKIKSSFIVVSLLPPFLHYEIAKLTSDLGVNMITASYLDDKIKSLNKNFIDNNCFLFMEMGLDPGIDHMSAMSIINKLEMKSKILEFESYTGGLMKFDPIKNPWGYKFTWNPMNVILAGKDNAKYLKNNIEVNTPYKKIFQDYTNIEIPNYGNFEGYPNRNSMQYIDLYNLKDVRSLKRGTLRHKGFCKAWNAIINSGLTKTFKNKTKFSRNLTYFEFLNQNIKAKSKKDLKKILEEKYDIKSDSIEFKNLEWSGLFSDKKVNGSLFESNNEILLEIMKDRWTTDKNDIDLIVMYHSIIYEINKKERKIISYLNIEGDDNIYTAMSKTVGLPIAILIEEIIKNNLQYKGINLPFDSKIYDPILEKLKSYGIKFIEKEIST